MLDYAYCLSTKNRNQLLLIGYLLACGAVDGTRDPGQGAGNADRLQGREANTGTQTHPAQPSSPCQQPPEMFHDELSPLLNQAVSTMDATTGNRNTAWSGGFKASSLRMYG